MKNLCQEKLQNFMIHSTINKKAKGWFEGRSVVAVGFNDKKKYFEDPRSLSHTYHLNYHELKKRWYDIDRERKNM